MLDRRTNTDSVLIPTVCTGSISLQGQNLGRKWIRLHTLSVLHCVIQNVLLYVLLSGIASDVGTEFWSNFFETLNTLYSMVYSMKNLHLKIFIGYILYELLRQR